VLIWAVCKNIDSPSEYIICSETNEPKSDKDILEWGIPYSRGKDRLESFFWRASGENDHLSAEGIMQRSFFEQILNPWAVGLTFLIWICLGGLLLAQNIPVSGLPSGLPDDLSDMSPFNPCQGNLCGEPPPRCPWYFEADALFLRRDRIDSVEIVPIRPAISTSPIFGFSTDYIDEPFRVGPRVVFGRTLGESRWQIDGTYFVIDSWDFNGAIQDFIDQPAVHTDHFREYSKLQNIELNLRYTVPMPHDCLTGKLIFGLRYMSINEQFDYNTTAPTQLRRSSDILPTTRTTNDLFGPQIGGEFYFYAYQHCWIDLGIKGALCNNRALQAGTLTDSAIRDVTTFVGDLDLALVWQLTPHLTTRIGYQAIWVNDIAMAVRNVDPLQIDTIDTAGRAVYHGPHIGLECMW
jgi:hypothetical protein